MAEYYALIFFILWRKHRVVLTSSAFVSWDRDYILPLYILTGTDKRNLRSNEAS